MSGLSDDGRAAGRGTVVLTALQTLGRLVSVGFVLTATHRLGPDDFGRYSIVSSIVLLGTLIADFGTQPAITRAVSRDRGRSDPILSGTVLTSLALGLAVYAGAQVFGFLVGYPPHIRTDLALGALAIPVTAVLTSFLAVLDGYGLISRRAVLTFANVGLVALAGLGGVVLAGSVRLAILGLVAGPAVALVLAAASTRTTGAWTGRLHVDVPESRGLLRYALPFAALALLSAMSARFDAILLSVLTDPAETARYDLALRSVEALAYLTTALSAPALFILSGRLGRGDVAGAQRAFDRAVRLAYLVGLPMSAALVALHHELATGMFGSDYGGASVPLAVLGGAMCVNFVTLVQGSLILAGDHLRRGLYLSGAITATLVAVDLAVVGRWGANGAAVAMAAIQMVTVVAFAVFHRRTTGIRTALPSWGVLLAAGTVFAVCRLAAGNVVVAVLAGATGYVVVLVATRSLTLTDARTVVRLLGRNAEATPTPVG